MHRELFFASAATALPFPESGWVSWAPEVADMADMADPGAPAEPMFRFAAALSLLMWGCACLLAAWYA